MGTGPSNRFLELIAISGGVPYKLYNGTFYPSLIGNGQLDAAAPVIRSTVLNGKLYFADGKNWTYFDANTSQLLPWTATQGSLITDAQGKLPRLIVTWRGRILLSGYPFNPGEIAASGVSDGTDWNLAPVSVRLTGAWALSSSPLGGVIDTVTCMIPYTDDLLLIGTDHELWRLDGDPFYGGTLKIISNAMGIGWGMPWCRDLAGNIYFVSNQTAVYTMIPGAQPQPISQPIISLLRGINVDNVIVRLLWDYDAQGLHVFVTPFAGAAATTHFFYEQRTGAWWQDQFANNNHNPLCCVSFPGATPQDRVGLIGSWDGYVRSFSNTAADDDGTAIASSVVIGPILTKDLDEVMIKDVQAIMGAASGNVTATLLQGATAELAMAATPIKIGTWKAGRNPQSFIRRSNYASYVKLTASTPWAMEGLRARIQNLGKVRRRGFGL